MTIINSTLSGNSADNEGSGIFNQRPFNAGGTVTIIISTLSDNSANHGGGIFNHLNGTVNVTNSTLSGNSAASQGGGIYLNGSSGVANIKNSIIAGNTATTFFGPDVYGTFISQGYNLIGTNFGSEGFPAGNPNENNDIVGSSAAPIDPKLGPLADNGGPTETMELLLCSPAIDKGSAATDPATGNPIATDQRGEARPVDNPAIQPATGGDDSDIGAFEAPASLVCNTPPTIAGATIDRQQGAVGTVSTIAAVSDAEDDAASLSVEVTSVPAGITVTGLAGTGGTITANVAASCSATLDANTVGLKVTDPGGLMAESNLTVNVTPSAAPVIHLKPSISLWPPNHSYRTITMSEMLLAAIDDCDGNLDGAVVIEKVTSDEPDNVSGGSDGETVNDIVIWADSLSVSLRAERDENKNGRVYTVVLRVLDTSGNVTRAVFKLTVPLSQGGATSAQPSD